MLTSQTFDYDEATFVIEENEADKAARLNRLKAWKNRVKLTKIDKARIRPMAAIDTGKANEYDRNKLVELETIAEALRAELATLTEVTS